MQDISRWKPVGRWRRFSWDAHSRRDLEAHAMGCHRGEVILIVQRFTHCSLRFSQVVRSKFGERLVSEVVGVHTQANRAAFRHRNSRRRSSFIVRAATIRCVTDERKTRCTGLAPPPPPRQAGLSPQNVPRTAEQEGPSCNCESTASAGMVVTDGSPADACTAAARARGCPNRRQ